MFGQIRENILTSLTLNKDNQIEFKNKFALYTKALKESKDLNDYYSIYEQIEEAFFDGEKAEATEFLVECLDVLSKLDRKSVLQLKTLSEGVDVKISERLTLLDQLVFNKKLTIKEKHDFKLKLIKNLMSKPQKQENKQEMFYSLDKKINSLVTNMSVTQKEVLNLFLENDESKIKKYSSLLIEGLIETLDELTLTSNENDELKKIVETKRKLQSMRNELITINRIETLLELKESFSKKI